MSSRIADESTGNCASRVDDAAEAAKLLSQSKDEGGVLVRVRRGKRGRYMFIETKG